MVGLACALAALGLSALGEALQTRRTNRVARLAFGPAGRPRVWARWAGPLRCSACAALAWGLVLLFDLSGATPAGTAAHRVRRLVIALDVSPSMELADAGPSGDETRARRARALLGSILERLDLRTVRVSIVAFWTGALPIVVDTQDAEVLRNILADLPMAHAFRNGKTGLYDPVKECAGLARAWPKGEASLLLVSDGDTVPAAEPPALSPAFSHTLLLGVGDPKGRNIDGHLSRHDIAALAGLARRLGGTYCDGNLKHLSSELLSRLVPVLPEDGPRAGAREWALSAVLAGAAVLAFLSPALTLWGSPWPRRAVAGETEKRGCHG